jgi:hypothetical protein
LGGLPLGFPDCPGLNDVLTFGMSVICL